MQRQQQKPVKGDAVQISVPDSHKKDYGHLDGQRGRLMELRGNLADVQLLRHRETVLLAWLSPAPRW